MDSPNTQPPVAVLLGSKSDLDYGNETMEALASLGVEAEMKILSAHRSPDASRDFTRSAAGNGVKIIIALAGAAAHLPGVVAGWTQLPVIGVPLPTSELRGVDSLHAIVQMPGGIPVATMAIGKAGARNAAIFAAEVLALNDDGLAESLRRQRAELTRKVLADSEELASR